MGARDRRNPDSARTQSRAALGFARRTWAGMRAWLAGLWSLAALVLRHAPVTGVLLIVQGAVAGAVTPLVVWALAGLIDALGDAQANLVQGTESTPWPAIAPWLAILAAAFLARSLQDGTREYLVLTARRAVDGALHRRVFTHAVALPLAIFEAPDYYGHLENGRPALRGAAVQALRNLTGLLAAIVGTAGLVALFAGTSWLLALILVATTVVRAAVSARLAGAFERINYESSPRRRELAYWAGMLSAREAAPELRLFGLGDYLVRRWRGAFGSYTQEVMTARQRHAAQVMTVATVQHAIGWVVIAALLLMALGGAVSTGALVGLLYGVGRFFQVSGTLTASAADLARHTAHLAHLRAFLALPADHVGEGRPVPRPMREGVRFEAVSFVYPGAARPALANVDLLLRPGERIALVGENGAGKTTLVKLLLGLYRPTAGRITVDGVPLEEINPAAWRHEVAAVFQEFVRYPLTVEENVAIGDPALLETFEREGDANPAVSDVGADGSDISPGTDEAARAMHPRIAAAMRASGATDVARALPRGYETPLAREFEGGVDLSTGQWQRLALARAYVRTAQIVVLDEPTSALDPRAEVEVYRQFAQAAAGRCAVFISHRLGSARLADRIVVLKDGCVIEQGSHDALVTVSGHYAHLYALQATWYADPPVVPATSEAVTSADREDRSTTSVRDRTAGTVTVAGTGEPA